MFSDHPKILPIWRVLGENVIYSGFVKTRIQQKIIEWYTIAKSFVNAMWTQLSLSMCVCVCSNKM